MGISKDFGSMCIVPSDLSCLLLGWRNKTLNAFGNRVWRLVPATVCWAIWLERNNRVFKGQAEPAWKVYRRAKELIVFWARRCKGYDGLTQGDLLRHWEVGIGLSMSFEWGGCCKGSSLIFFVWCRDSLSPCFLFFVSFFKFFKRKKILMKKEEVKRMGFNGLRYMGLQGNLRKLLGID